MKIHPHPRFEKIRSYIAKIKLNSYDGVVFRYVSSKYASSSNLLSGTGAFRAGARWNPIQAFKAVHCASTADLAHQEYLAAFRKAGINDEAAFPLTGKAIQVNLDKTIDLREESLLKKNGISKEQIKADEWQNTKKGEESLCQAIGRCCFEVGIEGLLVPSAQSANSDEYNVVLIVDNIEPGEGKLKILRRKRN